MELSFTFGICAGSNTYLPEILKSIQDLNIPHYEIIIVGDQNKINLNSSEKIKVINFDERVRAGWITKKKNIITAEAQYENITYQHDYIKYDLSWYEGYKRFGEDFKVCMNQIKNANGERFRDWVLYPYHHTQPPHDLYAKRAKALWDHSRIENNESMLPYEETRLVKYQYISGAYWVAKKTIMQEIPLNEGLIWGTGEDVEWSERILDRYRFSMNANSTVHFCKRQVDAFLPIRQEQLDRCIEFVSI